MNKVIVGRVIRLKRQEKGLNIGDLAGEDISTGTISRIENGAEVTDRKFYCLIEKLGLSTRELVRQVRELEEDDERLLYQLLGIESTLDHYGAEGLKEAK